MWFNCLTIVCSVFGLAFAVYLARWVLQKDDGTQEMRTISDAIREGAEAFLRRQYGTITLLTVPVTVILFVLYAYIRPENAADPVDRIQMAIYVRRVVHFWRLVLRQSRATSACSSPFAPTSARRPPPAPA